jgi:hypothetical protein
MSVCFLKMTMQSAGMLHTARQLQHSPGCIAKQTFPAGGDDMDEEAVAEAIAVDGTDDVEIQDEMDADTLPGAPLPVAPDLVSVC